jgi:glycosyltransferase involved in cell wall biosynthesis
MTLISVVIPALNDAEMLANCLAALATQTRPANEIIVVDNGSADDTATVARAAGARVVDEPLRGIFPATAAGFDAARGEIIARLDADSVPYPDWLERVEATFEASPELSALTGPGDFYGANRFLCWVGERIYIGGYFFWVTPVLGHAPLFGSNLALRSSVWKRVRPTAHRTLREVHDDLDLSFQVRPDMTVLYDPTLRVGVSARPFYSWRGLGRRLAWAYTTFQLNFREETPWQRRAARRAYAVRDAVKESTARA